MRTQYSIKDLLCLMTAYCVQIFLLTESYGLMKIHDGSFLNFVAGWYFSVWVMSIPGFGVLLPVFHRFQRLKEPNKRPFEWMEFIFILPILYSVWIVWMLYNSGKCLWDLWYLLGFPFALKTNENKVQN